MEALLSLHRLTAGIPGLAQKLIGIYGSASAVFREFDQRLSPLTETQRHKIVQVSATSQHKHLVDADMQWQSAPLRTVLCLGDSDYPKQLASISDPPLVLFAWGNASVLEAQQVAVVGSRRATSYGMTIAEQFSSQLAAAGLVITSGMALGVDGAAHRGALKVGGKTIAIQASGAGGLYPRRHERLGLEIVEAGCILTEYPVGMTPRPHLFPQRNRIVTGLARAILVIEAAQRSGSLVSARLAMEQGRDVFAVPGSVLSDRSDGCHRLIQDGAKLTASLTDILEEFGEFEVVRHRRQVLLSELEKKVVVALQDGPAHADRLHELTQIGIPELMAALMGLEIKGEIQSSANGYQLNYLP